MKTYINNKIEEIEKGCLEPVIYPDIECGEIFANKHYYCDICKSKLSLLKEIQSQFDDFVEKLKKEVDNAVIKGSKLYKDEKHYWMYKEDFIRIIDNLLNESQQNKRKGAKSIDEHNASAFSNVECDSGHNSDKQDENSEEKSTESSPALNNSEEAP